MNDFRIKHNKQISGLFVLLFFLHIPVFALMAWHFETEYSIAIGLTAVFSSIAAAFYYFNPSSRLTADAIAFTAMCLSGICIHLGRGLGEAHFHVFGIIACLTAFGAYRPVIVATLTIAVHHLSFFYLLPKSLLIGGQDYMILSMHVIAVVFEAVPCLFIAHKFSRIIDNQGTVITELHTLAIDNNSVSGRLSTTSADLSDSSSRQASSIHETSATLTELTEMMNRNVQGIEASKGKISGAFEMTSHSREAIGAMAQSIQDISHSNETVLEHVESNNKRITDIIAIINEVNQKTQVINDIVFQTKLLSFNASVEAARAGEHGKGFAVVAEEVGNLAQMSGSAAVEINKILAESSERVRQIVEETKTTVERLSGESRLKVQAGARIAEGCVKNLDELYNEIKDVMDVYQSIADSSMEQLKGVSNINEALQQFQSSLNATTTSAEEANELSIQLASQSKALKALVAHLKGEVMDEVDSPSRSETPIKHAS